MGLELASSIESLAGHLEGSSMQGQSTRLTHLTLRRLSHLTHHRASRLGGFTRFSLNRLTRVTRFTVRRVRDFTHFSLRRHTRVTRFTLRRVSHLTRLRVSRLNHFTSGLEGPQGGLRNLPAIAKGTRVKLPRKLATLDHASDGRQAHTQFFCGLAESQTRFAHGGSLVSVP